MYIHSQQVADYPLSVDVVVAVAVSRHSLSALNVIEALFRRHILNKT